MQGFVRILAGLTAGALLAGPITAQVPGSVLKEPVGTMEQAKFARRVLVNGVTCLLDQRPSNVRSFLKMFPDGKDAARAATYLNQGDCVDGQSGGQQMRFGPAMLRGAIYKAMYIRAFGTAVPELGATPGFAAETDGQSSDAGRAYVAARAFGECVVRRDPGTARALVLAEVESTDERKALTAIAPSFAGCMQKDQPELTRAGVTGVIAEVLYRLSKPESGKNA